MSRLHRSGRSLLRHGTKDGIECKSLIMHQTNRVKYPYIVYVKNVFFSRPVDLLRLNDNLADILDGGGESAQNIGDLWTLWLSDAFCYTLDLPFEFGRSTDIVFVRTIFVMPVYCSLNLCLLIRR